MTIEEGSELARLRKRKKWSQWTLGNKLGISQQYINKMENAAKPVNFKAREFIRGQNAKHKGVRAAPTLKGVKKKLKIDEQKSNGSAINCFDRGSDEEKEECIDIGDVHPLCSKCKQLCKQLDTVRIMSCPQFKKLKKGG